MHSFINFTVLGIEVIKVFRKIITLRIRNQKELELFSSTAGTGEWFSLYIYIAKFSSSGRKWSFPGVRGLRFCSCAHCIRKLREDMLHRKGINQGEEEWAERDMNCSEDSSSSEEKHWECSGGWQREVWTGLASNPLKKEDLLEDSKSNISKGKKWN